MRHLRSLAIAAVVLMISAAVAFAGGGPAWKAVTSEASPAPSPSVAPSTDPSVAPSTAPLAAPVVDPSASPAAATTAQTTDPCADEDADDEDADDADGQAPTASTAPDAGASTAPDAAEACHPENHGKAVSEAAHSGPPEESTQYRNHGAWVSSVARQNHGQSKKTDVSTESKAKGAKPGDDSDDDD